MIKKSIALFKEALRSEERDYTRGSLRVSLFLLAIPMIFEMVMESLFAIVDTFFVSRISTEAVATIGITESILMIIESVAIGISIAGTALIARRVGEKKIEEARKVVFNVIVVGIVFAVIVGVFCFVYASDILRWMGSEPELIAQGKGYTSIILGFNIFLVMLFVINGVFRGAGNAAIAMRTLWLANGLNIVLDPLLIFGLGPIPGMGLEGAAIATCIGRGSGVVYQWLHLYGGKSGISITLKDFKLSGITIRKIISLTSGAAGQFLISTASWIFLVRIINYFGSAAVAGYTIAIRIIIFSILPSWGLSNAVATLTGQNLGAGKPDRAERTVWMAGRYNMYFLIVMGIVFFIFAYSLTGVFTQDKEVMKYGAQALKILCTGYIFYAYQMVIGQAFNGAGDTRTPALLNVIALWCIQIPMAYFLSVVWQWGPNGVFVSIAFSNAILAALGIWVFTMGMWKNKIV
ncbi:MAG TPA: MATE family efflux transporter [Saprospiraceae bacterium]|nr:MATE family efflux transporter [Saprospiraceae bacterium]